MPTNFLVADALKLNTKSPGLVMVVCCCLQPLIQKRVLAEQSGQVRLSIPPSLLRSAFGGDWQQAEFRVQLSVFKDNVCLAGRRVAARRVAAQQRLLTRSYQTISHLMPVSFACKGLCAVCASCFWQMHNNGQVVP
jgi:hypothetical protein